MTTYSKEDQNYWRNGMVTFSCECDESEVCMCEEIGECACEECDCDYCSQQISLLQDEYQCGCGGNCQCGAYEE